MEWSYLSLIDYIFLGYTCIVLIIILIQWVNGAIIESLTTLLILSIPLAIMYYTNYIPKGIYQARIIEINKVKIGNGTNGNKPFEFYISSNQLKVDGHIFISEAVKPPIIELYLTKYKSKDGKIVIITKMGTTIMFEKEVEAIIKVNY